MILLKNQLNQKYPIFHVDWIDFMDKYRKLTKEELRVYGFGSKDTSSDNVYRDFARKYYPKEAALVEIVIHSEYIAIRENSITYVAVYDKNGDELLPLKESRVEARRAMTALPLTSYRTNDGLDSLFIRMEKTLPDFYIKES